MKFILGKKMEMTQKYDGQEQLIPVTKVLATPCFITQIKSLEKDGYLAVQVGGKGRTKHLNKAQKGHLKDLGILSFSKEFRLNKESLEQYKVGDQIDVSSFQEGDIVSISGTSRGRGFQGVVKRHHFSGSPASHGHKDQLRMPGSSGATDPHRVIKGKRMGGRMGGDEVTVQNLKIIEVDKNNNLLYIKGAIPGFRNSLVVICQKS